MQDRTTNTSDMNYEQKYNEALERAKKLYNSYNRLVLSTEEIEEIFPELAESEDERIRKELIIFILYRAGRVLLDKETEHRFVAYLEKQKEQKPSLCDKCENKSTCLDVKYDDGRAVEQCINFVEMEQKPEWGEDDEDKLKAICTYLQDYPRLAKLGDKLRFNKYCDFLKSLKPQKQDNNISISPERLKELRDKSFEDGRKAGIVEMAKSMWKPSEEQMGALQVAAMVSQTDFETLTSLLVDLMKLKEDKK